MALADTSRAIGAVSRALKARIDAISGVSTSVGRPSDVSAVGSSLNLFLYEVHFDEHLKNTPLNEGEKPPLWLVLKYLLTAFESNDDSDSESAHDLLGAALRAVYTDDLLRLDGLAAVDLAALSPNPSPLHLSFEPAPADVAAKLMQGPDDKIRLSACFQVRPVMIAAAEPGDYSLLVGIDYTQAPPSIVAETPLVAPVGIEVIPSMGAVIERIEPTGFEIGEEVSVFGTDLHLSGLTVQLGPIEFGATMQKPDELRFRIDPAIVAASEISAGSHAVAIVQNLAGGKKRRSNAVIGNLVPSLRDVSVVGALVVAGGQVSGTVELAGDLLGSNGDDVVVALYRDGNVTNMFDEFTDVPATPRQTARRFDIPPAPPPPDPEKKAVDAGTYNFILIVNGQQSPMSPRLELS